MKVWKEKGKYSGWNIYCKVGKNVWKSWWSSPPKDISHVGVSYLQDRYFIIKTKKRAEQFFSLYKNLWISVTDYQLELMQHCIGLDYKKKPYRNYFCTQETDKDWNELVKKGLALKGTKKDNEFVYFWLSKQGAEFVLGKSISDKVYREL